MGIEKPSFPKPEIPDSNIETNEKEPTDLLTLLERRAAHSEGDVGNRVEQLRNAIQELPGELTALLSEFESDLENTGVASLEVYVLGGFAREATGEINDEETGMNTSIRPDTDIDIFILCTPKDGITINPSRIPSPFSPILRKWANSKLANVVEITFGVTGTSKSLRPGKPKILLSSRDLSDAK
jgi:hypothetical protein